MSRKLRVFLCHASQDKPAVRELYKKLAAEPWIEPWLDEEELYPGQDWNMEIEKAVEAADAIIVCLSKGSITKEGYVQREIRTALDYADYKPEGTLYIIPVRLEECEPPRRLRSWQYADYFEGQRGRAFQRLLVSLKRRADALGLMAEEIERKQVEEPVKREDDDMAVREKLELAAAEKVKREKAEREVKEKTKREARRKKQREFVGQAFNLISANSRLLGMGGIILLVLIFGGFGLNYLINHLPVATAPSPTSTATFEPPTLTSIPFTRTPQPTETLIPTPTLGVVRTEISPKDGMTLLYVPAGEFTMGSDANLDEQPIHQVTLDAFWIDQTEVTNAMYAKCVVAGKCDAPNFTSRFRNLSYANHPVVYVSWNDAVAYCSWADRRLPTEAEWEKAARGPNANIYPWGNDAPNKDLLNYNQNVGDTTAVKSYESGKSFYGAYDMAGNVWEWVNDWYGDTYYQSSPSSNPLGPGSGQYRVLRGGSWVGNSYDVRSAGRYWDDPSNSFYNIGFRCSRSQ